MGINVLVLGGVGFIGRNLVIHLVENNLATYIRVADKAMPAVAYFNSRAVKAFDDERVDCRQANLGNKETVEKVYGDGELVWDIVFNLAAETKYFCQEANQV
jgi:nucleoside-diphosphate-sugar epimerase